MDRRNESTYRWRVLILAGLTNTLAVAIPSMCLPVLFNEISGDLHLNLVQIGLIWGIGSLPSLFMSLVGGALSDRFGPQRILRMSCFLAGLAGAMRGLSGNFLTLSVTVFLFGLISTIIPMNNLKLIGIWFPSRQLGLASGVLSGGMALGFIIGSLISATLLSPWLGGWRNVLFIYGALAMLLSLPWFFTRSAPSGLSANGLAHGETRSTSMRQALAHVARVKNVWWLGLAMLGIGGCIQGTLGYIPIYLQSSGWSNATADGALATFHTVSLIFVIPIALLSDKLGTRKKILMGAAILIVLGVSMLSIGDGWLVWVAVCLAGLTRDGFMAVFMTMIIESPGVGAAYAGTAVGLAMVFSGFGSLLAPPLGNSLAGIAPGTPFIFWAALTGVGLVGLYLTKETRPQHLQTASSTSLPLEESTR